MAKYDINTISACRIGSKKEKKINSWDLSLFVGSGYGISLNWYQAGKTSLTTFYLSIWSHCGEYFAAGRVIDSLLASTKPPTVQPRLLRQAWKPSRARQPANHHNSQPIHGGLPSFKFKCTKKIRFFHFLRYQIIFTSNILTQSGYAWSAEMVGLYMLHYHLPPK